MNRRKKIIYGILVLTIVLVGVIGASFALWTQNFTQSGENTIASDCFQITLNEEKGISLENSFPMYDKDGKKLTPYTFQVSNICDRKVEYQLNFETTNNSTLKDNYVKFMFQKEEPVILSEKERTKVTLSNGKSAYVLEKGYLTGKTSKEYSIRIWMDEKVTQADSEAMNQLFEGKITITASYLTRYYEEILNGTDPVLKDGLIPVTIDNNGTVKKADITKEWYKYESQKWANAVILEDENQVYQSGQVIPENNIESYFVWIPRYKYKIWNMGKYEGLTSVDYNQVHTIEVVFGVDTTTDSEYECRTPNQSGSDGTCSVGKYMTHPAFTAFDTESNVTKGIWVGKFETGYKDALTKEEAQKNENNPGKIQIKPDVYSWRGIQVANAYLSSYNYRREYDSHMMKNTEWGSVAYLQHSKYGSQASVRINNNSEYKTGYSGVHEPACGYTGKNEECNKYGIEESITKPWNTDIGYLSSTTGNISGIYDMSGGAWEYVMGVMTNQEGIPCSGKDATYNSGFNGPYCNASGLKTDGINYPDSKYYDIHSYLSIDEGYQRRILGDATGEMGPFMTKTYGTKNRQIGSWYDDEAWFLHSGWPWFFRGGLFTMGLGAGVFGFLPHEGHANSDVGFRIVLSL